LTPSDASVYMNGGIVGRPPDDRENALIGDGSQEWLSSSVGYEVYIRSFADSNADGVGDMAGLTAHLDHLAWLGVDIVWITPFYPSPMADYGYDVADYTGIDPLFGDLNDFDLMVERAHELGLKVVIDIVPNHTSDAHPWFEASLAEPDGRHRDYYIWRDPAPDGGPPNNWLSHFGGRAWTLDESSGQYYLHLFLPEQPDLNWRNPDVAAEFEEILGFWLKRGIDGFRIDVAHAMVKDAQLRDNPMLLPLDGITDARYRFACMDHRYDLAQPGTLDIYLSWRQIVEPYDAVLIGETYLLDAADLAKMLPGDGLHTGFWFTPMHVKWSADEIRQALSAATEAVPSGVGWVQSSHDESRPVARFGGGDLGRRRSLGLSVLMMGLPGVPFIYQGEELGLDDGVVPADRLTDPVAVRNDGSLGRDPCRTPMPWGPGPNLGFSAAADTWLPIGHDERWSVAAQMADPASHLHRVRELLEVRRSIVGLADAPTSWLDCPGQLVAFSRAGHIFVLNTGESSIEWRPGGTWTCAYRSVAPRDGLPAQDFSLESGEALILSRSASVPA